MLNKFRPPQKLLWIMCSLLLLLTGCEKSTPIVSNISEREANLILVLLVSKGIPSSKIKSSSGTQIGGETNVAKYQIMVRESQNIEAIAILNQNGFPTTTGINLLQLFAKKGLMSSDKEETIRYQAGLAQQLTNTILTMDGVIDAAVQLSFPPTESVPGQTQTEPITASIYVKHQGVFDDPNLHLESKIKRFISGSISGLNINDVTLVTDRSRFADITLHESSETLSIQDGEYVSIWSIIMNKQSASRFRILFFFLTTLLVVLAVVLGWIFWKFYPTLKKQGGIKELLNPVPISSKRPEDKPPSAKPK